METRFMVLCNVLNGFFITHAERQDNFDDQTNPRVPAYTEIIILKEFSNAVFVRMDAELERAETPTFYFHRFAEDSGDDIIWVEPKGMQVLPD